ncbi:MAG: MFS transporter [Candidatus Schekmanbacteria bacterium]|nr:MAG: MFS transporter [Candidatus Schekmanbacteria bacterium]
MSRAYEIKQKESKLGLLFRSLRHRNYRLFFIGQSISLIGVWMQQIAIGWLVYRITGSALLLGIISFCSQFPSFLLSPFAGVFADRLDRKNVILLCQILAMMQALTLAALTFTHLINTFYLIVLSIFIGIVISFEMPTRQSFILDIVEKREDLANAIALNSSMFNGARLLGPTIAGLIIGVAGEGLCFLINGLSYIAVIISLMMINVKGGKGEGNEYDFIKGLKEGFTYSFGFYPIKSILLLVALISLLGMPYLVLMPVFAKDILKGGPDTLGFLMGASGLGAFGGAIYLAMRKSVMGLAKLIAYFSFLFSVGISLFALSSNLWISLILMFVTGYAIILQMASSNTLLQTIADDSRRGRVMSFFTMAMMGMSPIGSFLAGTIADSIGAQETVFICGLVCFAGTAVFAKNLPQWRKEVKPIYEKKGIISKAG